MRLSLVVLCTLAACGSKKKQEPPPAAPPPEPPDAPAPPLPPTAADALWALAPTDAVAGIVIADGALPALRAGWAALATIAADEPYTAALATSASGALAQLAGFDPFAPGLESSLDLARGAAVFFDADGRVILAALPPAVGATIPDAGSMAPYGEAVAGLPCATRGQRVVCATAPAPAAPGALAAVATSLPADRRGAVELVIDVPRVPALQDARARVGPVVDQLASFSIALVLEPGAVRARVLARGERGARYGALLRPAAPAPLLDDLSADSPSAVRLSVDPAVVAAGDLPLTADLASVWTGEVGLFARGAGVLAGVIAVGVSDEARARMAIGPICNKLLRPLGPIQRLDETHCRVTMALPREIAGAEPVRERIYAALAETPIVLDVHRGALRVRFGDPDEPPPAPASGAIAAPLHLRASALGPLALADDELAGVIDASIEQLPGESRARIAGVRWILAQVAELDLSAALEEEGLRLDLDVVGFASDGAATYAAYREAVGSLRSGDRAAFRQALEALRRAHPGTRAARQADAVLGGAPVLGPASLVALVAIPAVVGYVEAQRGGEPAADRR